MPVLGPFLTADDVGTYAYAAGFPLDQIHIAVAVSHAESGFGVNSYNVNTDGSEDLGLWQINSVHGYAPAFLRNPYDNAKAAYGVWHSQGWGVPGHPGAGWTTFSTGAYIPWLYLGNQAQAFVGKYPRSASVAWAEHQTPLAGVAPVAPVPGATFKPIPAPDTPPHPVNWSALAHSTGQQAGSDGSRLQGFAAAIRRNALYPDGLT